MRAVYFLHSTFGKRRHPHARSFRDHPGLPRQRRRTDRIGQGRAAACAAALTGLRFIAAMAVLLYHFGAAFAEHSGVPGPIARMLHNGYLGVSLFFVLSGYILTYTHQRDAIDGRFLADFYVARFARIPGVPVGADHRIARVGSPLSSKDVAAVLTMTQSWTAPASSDGYLWVMQAWTLSVELFFYVFFPAILLAAKQLSAPATALAAMAAAIVNLLFGIPSITPGTSSIPHLASPTLLPIPLLRSAEFVYGVMLCRLTVCYPGLSRVVRRHIFRDSARGLCGGGTVLRQGRSDQGCIHGGRRRAHHSAVGRRRRGNRLSVVRPPAVARRGKLCGISTAGTGQSSLRTIRGASLRQGAQPFRNHWIGHRRFFCCGKQPSRRILLSAYRSIMKPRLT